MLSERFCMPVYHAPVKDTLFLLNEMLGIERYANLPVSANATPDLVEAMLSEAGKFCEEVLFPLNYSGDLQGLQIGRARRRERVCQYVKSTVVSGTTKKKKQLK